jgi:hypothetical protein
MNPTRGTEQYLKPTNKGELNMSATATAPVTNGRTHVSNEQFVQKCVEASQQGKGNKWIADQLGMKPATATQRRAMLKAKGVKFPESSRSGNKVDADSLNTIIANMTNTPLKDVKAAGESLKKSGKAS